MQHTGLPVPLPFSTHAGTVCCRAPPLVAASRARSLRQKWLRTPPGAEPSDRLRSGWRRPAGRRPGKRSIGSRSELYSISCILHGSYPGSLGSRQQDRSGRRARLHRPVPPNTRGRVPGCLRGSGPGTPRWEELADAPRSTRSRGRSRFSGLGRRKARASKLRSRLLIDRFGSCTLEPTRSWSDEETLRVPLLACPRSARRARRA